MSTVEEIATMEFEEALEGLKHIRAESDTPEAIKEANEKLEIQRVLVEEKKNALLKTSESFRQLFHRNKELAAINAHTRQIEIERYADQAVNRQVGRPEITSMVQTTGLMWACLKCGRSNINYRGITGRTAKRKFSKWYKNHMKEMQSPLKADQIQHIIKKGVPYCVHCTSKGDYVYLVKRPKEAVLELKKRLHEEKTNAGKR